MPEMELTVKLRWHFEPGDDAYPDQTSAWECLDIERDMLGGEAPSLGVAEYIGIVGINAEVAWRFDLVPEGSDIRF